MFPSRDLPVAIPLLIAFFLLLALLLGVAPADEERIEFRYDPRPSGEAPRRVCLAGEFNGWSPDAWPMERGSDGVFRREVPLARGVYRYKFVVDGEWTPDPANPLREEGGHGNSVRVVGDAPVPDLSAVAVPRPERARPGAFQVIPVADAPRPPGRLRPRGLFVYLPPSYEAAPARRYPVLYLHDGQNVWSDPRGCFGHGGWYLDEACERLWAAGELEEVILVGVPNSPERMQEYGTADLSQAATAPYVRYLAEAVKPWVDARYRTRSGPADTAIMGSSMGGLISFVAALARPDVFGKAACLSSSFWFTDARDRSVFDLLALRGRQPVRLYLDSGTDGPGGDGVENTRRMAAALRAAGWGPGEDLMHHVAEGAAHNERAWRARAELPLRFLFPPR